MKPEPHWSCTITAPYNRILYYRECYILPCDIKFLWTLFSAVSVFFSKIRKRSPHTSVFHWQTYKTKPHKRNFGHLLVPTRDTEVSINIPLVNNALLAEVDNHMILSSYRVSTNSFYHHRKATGGQPSVEHQKRNYWLGITNCM